MQHSIDVSIEREISYSVNIGMDIWDAFLSHCSACYSARKIFVVIDSNVNKLHGETVKEQCKRYFDQCQLFEIPAGERSKSVKYWNQLQDKLLNGGVERSTPLLAVGGGVTGDLAGFTAASVLRGIPLIHMPTSVLAMVDSSIGGKTGVNHTTGKNLIGAFYQPDAVFAGGQFLETLPAREWANGMAEMLKHAAICKPELIDQLQQAANHGFNPSGEWIELIYQSAKIKIDVVQEDVREAGKRAFLNFGHTFGHALEKKMGYGTLSHGEAVYVGMLAATYLSRVLGAPVSEARFLPFKSLYKVTLPQTDGIDSLIEMMKYDKKVKEETIRLILLDGWGTPYIKKCNDTSLLQEAWAAAFKLINT